ncbi:MAG: hypothetical protein KAW02_06775 [candidate division Zixibacteria bacterium]|nr:hypothetical protein [candidate division Zixibacteria bacterium]
MNIIFNIDVLQYVIIVMGYVLTIATSGLIVRHFIGGTIQGSSNADSKRSISRTNYDLGAIIGKCENLLTITLVLVNAFTGLALIFTAKSIIRSEHIKRNPKYYLGGTVVNFTYSFLMGFFIRILLSAIGHPI